MKFLHTADWQLGMKAVHAGAAAQRVRDERLTAAKRVVATAVEHEAEFIVVAGDTFEDNGIERLLVQKAADILALINMAREAVFEKFRVPLALEIELLGEW